MPLSVSSLLQSYSHPLTPHTDSEVHKHKAVIRDVGFILKIVDVGGLDLENVLSSDVLMTAQGFVLVYGANSRDSFVALDRIRKKIQQNKSEARIPIVLV